MHRAEEPFCRRDGERIGLDATGQPGNGLRNTEGAIADDGFRTEIRDNAAAAEDPEGG